MATYFDPNQQKKPQAPGVAGPGLTANQSAPGLTAEMTSMAAPASPGMPNPTGTSAAVPSTLNGGMPNPLGTSAPAPTNPGMPNPTVNPNDPFAAMGGGVQIPGGGWVPKNHPLAAQAGPQPTPGAPGGPTSAPGPTANGQPTNLGDVLRGTATPGAQPTGQPTTVAGAFQQALINRLTPQDLTTQNPAIKGTIAANRNAEARGMKQTQELLAERAAASGQSGGFNTDLRRAAGDSAGRQAAFEGNALGQLHRQQADELTNALALGGGLLSDQQRQELQRYGIDLDAALRREGYGLQRDLGSRELDIRNTLGQGQLDLGRRGLDQNESQFTRSLGANLGLNQARLNQEALLALLGGL